MSNSGYILIADITGYTAYLTKTELDHARDTLADLLNVVFNEIRHPLKVSKLEGDAVLAYAPNSAVGHGQTLIEVVEVIYGAFRKALELMVLNTSCKCEACKVISTLDLKFFVHHGEFLEQRIGPFVELVGTDVNVVHRLTKNSVGLTAYAMYTEAAIQAGGLGDIAAEFPTHIETYEHIGDIRTYVQDLAEVWGRYQSKVRLRVPEGEALMEGEMFFTVPPTRAWEYVTDPHTRAVITDSDTAHVDRIGGRITEGSVYHCAHGDVHLELMVVDWRPFDEYSYTFDVGGGVTVLYTIALSPTEEGVRVVLRVGHARGGTLDDRTRADADFMSRTDRLERGLRALEDIVRADLKTQG